MAELGSVYRLRRRPVTLTLKLWLFLLLLFSPSPSTLYHRVGDSVAAKQVRTSPPPTASTVSSDMAHGRSQTVHTVGRIPLASPPCKALVRFCSPIISADLLGFIFRNQEMLTMSRSELGIHVFKEIRTRSGLGFVFLRLRYDKPSPLLMTHILILKLREVRPNICGTDGTPGFGICFVLFLGLSHRQFLPSSNRYHVLCRIFFPTFVLVNYHRGVEAPLEKFACLNLTNPSNLSFLEGIFVSHHKLCTKPPSFPDLLYAYAVAATRRQHNTLNLTWERKEFGPTSVLKSPLRFSKIYLLQGLSLFNVFINCSAVSFIKVTWSGGPSFTYVTP